MTATSLPKTKPIVCKGCGVAFGCGATPGATEPCWCTAYPPAFKVPAAGTGATCLCPTCLAAEIAKFTPPAAEK